MIKDYKSQDTFAHLNGHRRHPKLGFIALVSLALTATAVYASFQIFQDEEGAKNLQPEDNAVVSEEVSQASPAPENQLISLPLPGITGTADERSTSTQTRTDAPSDVAEAATQDDPALTLQSSAAESGSEKTNAAEPLTLQEPTDDSMEIASIEQAAPESDAQESLTEEANLNWIEEKVKTGDSLSKIFSRLNLSPSVLHAIVNSSKEAKELANIRPGQTMKIRLDSDGALKELIHLRSRINSLQIVADGDSYKTEVINKDLETRVIEIRGTITNSLFQSAQEAGLSDTLIMDLAYIFGWDIDFALEIRAGDSFSVVYEEQYLEGEKIRNGAILAAEFINRGKVHRAIRYEDDEGYASYFSPDGNSMRKAFLRAPVDFRRISSRFSKERFHPVLGKKRPHRGVDYAASTGTPVKAAGDGKVIFVGRKGGYGKAIILKHANRYTTLYAHLNGFKRGIKTGGRVKQGQTIGYVGKTGVATGPHLHYEFRVDGTHHNPLTVKLPAALPIENKYRKDFMKKSKPLLAKLDAISNTMVADASAKQ